MEASRSGNHLKQVGRVEHEMCQRKTGSLTGELRYDLTHLHRRRFNAEPLLAGVKLPWAIANNGNRTVGVIWDADPKPWCGQGVGIQGCSVQRLLANNGMAGLRCRSCRIGAAPTIECRS